MTDVLIAGGGLAGGAAAISLARSGRTVRLMERNAGPADKICGEFLSIEAQQDLTALGIDLTALGAVPVRRLRLVAGGRSVAAPLPFVAYGLSRRRLDEALLLLAEAAGAHIERGVRVLELSGTAMRTSDGPRAADHIFLATGKHPVREAGRPDDTAAQDAHVGFKMHWRAGSALRAELGDHIELALFAGGYAGLQMVDGQAVNLCLAIRRQAMADLGGRWRDILAMLGPLSPAFRRTIEAEPLFARPVTVANLAYGRLPGRTQQDDGVFRLGDQGAMTASLTGDGMAIALRSGRLAAQCLIAGETAADYHRRFGRMVGRQVQLGMAFQRLAERPDIAGIAIRLLRMRPGLLRAMVGMTRLPGGGEEWKS